MRIIYLVFSVFMILAVVEAKTDAREEACAATEKTSVSGAVGNALGKAGEAVDEGVQKTKKAVGEGIHKTKEALEAGAHKTKDALVKAKDVTREVAGNVADKALEQVGFSMTEMNEAFECVGPIIDLLEKVSRNPHDKQTLEALKENRCRGLIQEFAFKCINPKILLAMAIPGIGVAISSACQTIQRLKERLDDAVKEDVAIYERKNQASPQICPKEHTPEKPGS